jgi:hypothetical protein
MTQSIDSVTFDKRLVWIDKDKYKDAIASVSNAIDGSEIVYVKTRGAHYPITLEGTAQSGWLKQSTIESLRALSAVSDATYTLNLDGDTYTVRFRNEQSGGVIQMQQRKPTTIPDADTWYFGTIYLMCTGG